MLEKKCNLRCFLKLKALPSDSLAAQIILELLLFLNFHNSLSLRSLTSSITFSLSSFMRKVNRYDYAVWCCPSSAPTS